MPSAIEDLLETMRRLRAPGGCPWDHEQTHQSLREPLMEETAELLDTIDREDYEHMREELGDVLLQVVFHAQIANESGRFDFDAVAREINDKLIRRHPHVFGDVQLDDSDAVLTQWEDIKAAEKRNGPEQEGVFKRLPPSLSSLMTAWNVVKQVQKKEIRHELLPDPEEMKELAEGLDADEAGSLLFNLVYAMRVAGLEPESVLRQYTAKVVREIEADT